MTLAADPIEEPTPAVFQLHMEPATPINVEHFVGSLGSLARQYQKYSVEARLVDRPADARLLVYSVAPGSIDIQFIPDVVAFAATVAPLIDVADTLEKFATRVKQLIDYFAGDATAPPSEITVSECDDAINIVKPIAEAGGSQFFNVIHGDVHVALLQTTATQARRVIENAAAERSRLLFPTAATRQRVSMVWTQLAKDRGKTKGSQSPDKALIADIDDRPHPIFFTDETQVLKSAMIDDQENPYRKVYFVDVEVSRVGDKITAYRIIGYHGDDDLPE